MANLCPNLERLHLHLCGQLQADTLKHWSKTLRQLKRVELYAPFLVRKDGWRSLIETSGDRLEGLLVTQSPRIDLETVQCLVRHCPNLSELRLAEIGLLDGDCLAAIAQLQHLTLLDLSAPSTSLNDGDVTALLKAAGGKLERLDLSDNPELTDLTLEAIAAHCPRLVELRLRNQVELSNEGVADFFTTLKAQGHPGFGVIELEKGHDLEDSALTALLAHSGNTIDTLSLLGWKNTNAKALEALAVCPLLRDLNLGWCRKLTDFALKEIIDGTPAMQVIRVWGTC